MAFAKDVVTIYRRENDPIVRFRSTVYLRKTGVYPYAAHRDTGIWCMAYVR